MKTKNFLIYAMLFAPIVANADNVGPATASGTPVVATASAPFATAGAETGDTTNVVSASYVKGAYNDAIAAVNKVNADKQGKLNVLNTATGEYDVELSSTDVVGVYEMDDYMRQIASDFIVLPSEGFFDDKLVTANGVATGIMAALARSGIRAVTTWGSNNTTVVNHVGDMQ